MRITRAIEGDECIVYNILYTKITEVYPKYYPEDVVTFFINHHSLNNIKSALNKEIILIIKNGEKHIGTGSILANEIRRMFILPNFQGKGYGTLLLSTLETIIKNNGYTYILLDSSLSAYSLYEKNGYSSIHYRKIVTPKGQFLCYNQMLKKI